jgi:hypothetical protein
MGVVNVLVAEGFLPVVDKEGLTSVNFNWKYEELNYSDFCVTLLTQSSEIIQINCCSPQDSFNSIQFQFNLMYLPEIYVHIYRISHI